MHAAHQHLPLIEVKPGMILSDELLDRQGQVLLPKGAMITDQILALLPGHEIGILSVLRTDAPSGPEPAVLEQRVNQLFRKNDPDNQDDWATSLLRRYMLDYRLDREIDV